MWAISGPHSVGWERSPSPAILVVLYGACVLSSLGVCVHLAIKG